MATRKVWYGRADTYAGSVGVKTTRLDGARQELLWGLAMLADVAEEGADGPIRRAMKAMRSNRKLRKWDWGDKTLPVHVSLQQIKEER